MQIQLARLLGRQEPPTFLHHPLLMKTGTQKLSKADGATGLRELGAQGWTPADIVGEALFRAGLAQESRPVSAEKAWAIAVGTVA